MIVQDVRAGEGYRATAGDAEDKISNGDKVSGYKTVGEGGVNMILTEMQETLEEISAKE